LQNGRVLEDLHRPSHDRTAEKMAVDVAQRALVLARWQGHVSSIRD